MSSFPGDYYRRLRLPKSASRQEIKAAFRRLSRQYHPDLHPNQPAMVMEFQALREAYEVLIDRVRREAYDQIQHQNGSITDMAISRANYRLRNPKTPIDYYLRGIRYAANQRYRVALEEYDQAIALNCEMPEAYLRRAEARYALGDDPGVLADCQRAIALNATESTAHYYLGLARFRLGYVQSAIAAFTNAIIHDPEDAQSFARRGIAREDLHEMAEAAMDLRRAAQLYKAQGDVAKYDRLRQYLRRFGTAGRSRPIRVIGWFMQKLLTVWSGLWLGLKAGLGIQHRSPEEDAGLLAESVTHDATIRQQSIDQFSLKPEENVLRPDPRSGQNSGQNPGRASDNYLYNRPANRRRRWPLTARPSRQVYWAPGVSSRPAGDLPESENEFWLTRLLGGFLTVVRLLSNPGGELVPVYHQLSHHQVNRVGYGLAVLANLCLMSGLMALFSQTSWLQASWLWAAGGMAYVAMVMTVAIARLCLRAKGLWAADIFTIGTAVVPIGLCAGIIVGIKTGSRLGGAAIAPYFPLAQSPMVALLTNLLILGAIFWALSQALIALYSGLCHLHPFPPRVAAWFAPTVLVVGIAVGVGTWGWLALDVTMVSP